MANTQPTGGAGTSIHTIETFKNKFQGGTRPNRFRITCPKYLIETHCLASTMPESTIGIITIPFRGRIYKFPGDRTYSEWTVTILDDNSGEGNVWQSFHSWSELYNSHSNNTATDIAQKGGLQTINIEHLKHDGTGSSLKKISLQNAWPVIVGPVELNMQAANTLTTFQVTFAYTHYIVGDDKNGGNGSGSGGQANSNANAQ